MTASAPIGEDDVHDLCPSDEDYDEYEAVDGRSAVFVGVYATGARCVLQYVLAPALGAFGFWLPWIGLIVQAVACLVTISGVIHLRRTGDRRWRFSAVIALVVVGSTVLATTGLLR